MEQLWAVVLAAGEGKRMHSKLPKVLHPLCGKTMVEYILESAAELTGNVLIVVGHGASMVQEALKGNWHYVLQEQQLGTGHAVLQALKELPDEGILLVLCGDTPLIEPDHLKRLLAAHDDNAATVATTSLPDPTGYGRIIRSEKNMVTKIVEEKDASDEEKDISEINTGTYCFDIKLLKHYLPLVSSDNTQNEYYLTDVISFMQRDGYGTGLYYLNNYRVGLGINNRVQLAEATQLLQKRINHSLMLKGVSMPDPTSVYTDADVVIGPDTEIMPNCVLQKGTIVGSDCRIGPGVHMVNAVIKDHVEIKHSVITDSTVNTGEKIGPYAYIQKEKSE